MYLEKHRPKILSGSNMVWVNWSLTSTHWRTAVFIRTITLYWNFLSPFLLSLFFLSFFHHRYHHPTKYDGCMFLRPEDGPIDADRGKTTHSLSLVTNGSTPL